MFTYGLGNWFRTKFIRIMIIVFILMLISIFARNQVTEYLSLAGLISSDSELTVSDYLIGMLNMPQFFMFFAFPVLFSILIADLITDDFEEGYALFILARVHNRTQYIFNKLYILLVASLFFMSLVIIISALTWVFLGSPISGENFHYIFIRDSEVGLPFAMTWLKIFSFFFLGVFSHGLLTLAITMYTSKPSLTIGLIIMGAFIHNALYVASQSAIVLLPLSQYVVGIHTEYEPFGFPIKHFDLMNSYFYMITISAFLIILMIRKFKNTDFFIHNNSN